MLTQELQKEVNDILKAVFSGRGNVVTTTTSDNFGEEKSQGDTGKKIEVVKFGEYFIKKVYEDDSYGSNETLESVSFVFPQVKQVTVYDEL